MSNSQIGPNLPVGSVIAFAGNPTTLQQMEGWYVCDGRELHKDTHLELFEAIRYANGGNGSTTFKLPDCRGYFLRGVNGDRDPLDGDPDAGNRLYPQPNLPSGQQGAKGNNVGSVELTATAQANSKFTVAAPHLPTNRVWADKIAGYTNARFTDGITHLTGPTGGAGTESRPINAYVDWYIKASL